MNSMLFCINPGQLELTYTRSRPTLCSMFRLGENSSRKNSSNLDGDYRKAISTLNTLQTNKQLPMKQYSTNKISTMLQYLARCNIVLQDLEQKLSVIHVAGTKGKGSTCAYCQSILRQYGYKTGFFSSPHLCSVRERIRINGEPLSESKFAAFFLDLYKRLEQNKEPNTDANFPPYFTFLTIMAFKVFIVEKVDVAVIEVGIGGEYDSTNILKNTAVVGISSLGYDHVETLGSTIEEIAWQKAGIIKPRSIVVTTADQPTAALQVLRDRAVEKGCTLYIAPKMTDYKSDSEIKFGIDGPVQQLNASLALQLVNAWINPQHYLKKTNELEEAPAFTLSKEMLEGLRTCSWPGRMQVLRYSPKLIYYLDGAHTAESIKFCLDWYKGLVIPSPTVKRILVFNMIGYRDTKKLLSFFLSCHFALVCFCTNRILNIADSSDDNWSLSSDEEDKRAEKHYNQWLELNTAAGKHTNAILLSSVNEVHELLKRETKQNSHVLVTGSLHLVGSFLNLLNSQYVNV